MTENPYKSPAHVAADDGADLRQKVRWPRRFVALALGVPMFLAGSAAAVLALVGAVLELLSAGPGVLSLPGLLGVSGIVICSGIMVCYSFAVFHWGWRR